MSPVVENCSDKEMKPRRYGREPSKGCEACRRLKIKCDERHPVCKRCRTRDLNCVYRDYSLVMFRDETAISGGKVRRRVRAKQQESENRAASPGLLAESKHIHLPVQPMAINRFFHDFILKSQQNLNHPNGRFLPSIPELFRHCEPHSCFSLALSAAANANFAKRHNFHEARWQSLNDYSCALQQLSKDLQQQDSHSNTAEMLAASSLMAMYELLVSRDLSRRKSFTAHVDGTMAFLGGESVRHRGMDYFTRGVQDVVLQMLTDCLIMGTHPKLPVQRFESVGARDTLPALLLVSMYKAAQLCATWRDFCSTRNGLDSRQRQDEMDDLLEKCQLLDEEIATWTEDKFGGQADVFLSNTKENIPVPFRSLFAPLGAPKVLRVFTNINQTHWYNFSRACRLTLLRTRMAIVDVTLASSTPDIDLINYKLTKTLMLVSMTGLVDDLLSTIFSTLTIPIPGQNNAQSMADVQGFRGLSLLWPLHTAGTSLIYMGDHCPDGAAKLDWVRTVFRCIRDDLGIQAANFFLQNNNKARCK